MFLLHQSFIIINLHPSQLAFTAITISRVESGDSSPACNTQGLASVLMQAVRDRVLGCRGHSASQLHGS